jgi:hypothetical protein
LGVGYGRGARLIDYMAEDGIVGPYNGSQAREVLVSIEQWEEMRGAAAGGSAESASASRAPARGAAVDEEEEDNEAEDDAFESEDDEPPFDVDDEEEGDEAFDDEADDEVDDADDEPMTRGARVTVRKPPSPHDGTRRSTRTA